MARRKQYHESIGDHGDRGDIGNAGTWACGRGCKVAAHGHPSSSDDPETIGDPPDDDELDDADGEGDEDADDDADGDE